MGEMEGETGILGKLESWGVFILRIGDRILVKHDIWKDLMSKMGRTSKSSRYVIDIIGTNLFSLEELGGKG